MKTSKVQNVKVQIAASNVATAEPPVEILDFGLLDFGFFAL